MIFLVQIWSNLISLNGTMRYLFDSLYSLQQKKCIDAVHKTVLGVRTTCAQIDRFLNSLSPTPSTEYHCKLMAAHTILSDQHLNKRPHQSRWQMGAVKSREYQFFYLCARAFHPAAPAKLISAMKYQFLQLSRAPLLGVKFTNGPISCVCLPRPGHRRWVIAEAGGRLEISK